MLRLARVVGADPRWIIGPANVGDAVNEAETDYGDLSPRERALLERWRFLGEVDRRYIEGFIAGRVGDEEEDLP